MDKKKEIYDEMCRLLTEYEETHDVNSMQINWETELYDMLIKIQNNWETVIMAE